MAALSSNIQGGRDAEFEPERVSVEVEDAEVVYKGAFTSVRDKGNATAANQGRIGAYTGAAGEFFIGDYRGIRDPEVPGGFAAAPTDEVTGDTSGSPAPQASAQISEGIYTNIAIAGVSSQSDVGAPVYLSSDNDLTLTPQTRPDPIGFVTRYRSSGVADFLKFGLDAYYGAIRPVRIPVSQRNITVTASSGNFVTGFPMPCKGILLAVGYEVGTQITDGGGAITTVVNAELGGTNVTGGTVALETGAVGAYKVGASFATAGHYFSRGTLLDLEVSGSQGPDAGAVYFFVDILPLSGT